VSEKIKAPDLLQKIDNSFSADSADSKADCAEKFSFSSLIRDSMHKVLRGICCFSAESALKLLGVT
jgi:hypothetical protein